LLYDDREAEAGVPAARVRAPQPRAACLPLRPWGCALLRAKLLLKRLGKCAAATPAPAEDAEDAEDALQAEAAEAEDASLAQAVLEGYQEVLAACAGGSDALCLLHRARVKLASRWLRAATAPPPGVLAQLERFAFKAGTQAPPHEGPAEGGAEDAAASVPAPSAAAVASSETPSSSYFVHGSLGQRLEAVLLDAARALRHVLKALPYHHRALVGLAHAHAERRRCQAACGPRARLTLTLAPRLEPAPPAPCAPLHPPAHAAPPEPAGGAAVGGAWAMAGALANTLFREWGLHVSVEASDDSDLPTLRVKSAHAFVAAQTGRVGSGFGEATAMRSPALSLADALAVCGAAFPDRRAKVAKGRLKLRKPPARPGAASWQQQPSAVTCSSHFSSSSSSPSSSTTTNTTSSSSSSSEAACVEGDPEAAFVDASPVFGFGLGLGEARSQAAAAAFGSWLDLRPWPGDVLAAVGGVALAPWLRAHATHAAHAQATADAAAAAAAAAGHSFPVAVTKWAFGFKISVDFARVAPDGTKMGVQITSFDDVPSDVLGDAFADGSAERLASVPHPAVAQGLQAGDVLVAVGEPAAAAAASSAAAAAPPPRVPLEHLAYHPILAHLRAMPVGPHTFWFRRPAAAVNGPTGRSDAPPPPPEPLPLAAGRFLLLAVERRSPHRHCSEFAAPPRPLPAPEALPPPPSLEAPPRLQLQGAAAAAAPVEAGDELPSTQSDEPWEPATQRMSLADSIRGDRDGDAAAGDPRSPRIDAGGRSSDEEGLSDLDDGHEDDAAAGIEQAATTQDADEAMAPREDAAAAEVAADAEPAADGGQGEAAAEASSSRAGLRRKRRSVSKDAAAKDGAAAKEGAASTAFGGGRQNADGAGLAAAQEAEVEAQLAAGPGGCADVDLLRRRGNQEAGRWLEKLLGKRLPQVDACPPPLPRARVETV
jgi:hypothetical protein